MNVFIRQVSHRRTKKSPFFFRSSVCVIWTESFGKPSVRWLNFDNVLYTLDRRLTMCLRSYNFLPSPPADPWSWENSFQWQSMHGELCVGFSMKVIPLKLNIFITKARINWEKLHPRNFWRLSKDFLPSTWVSFSSPFHNSLKTTWSEGSRNQLKPS